MSDERTRAGARGRPLVVASVASVAVLVVLVALIGASGGAAAQDDPTRAPVGSTSADGRTVSAPPRTLTASRVDGLVPGQAVGVAGSGYDPTKGIYVALCVIPPVGAAPSPCGGGADRGGTQGASSWISSDPPSYAVGLTTPYGDGGSFSVTFGIDPLLAPGVDCRQVRCALVTRNDHLRSSDRSQDLLLPVTFGPAVEPPAPAPTPTQAPTPAASAPSTPRPAPVAPDPPGPTTTLAPPPAPATTTPTTVPAPTATVAADGLSASDGTRSLALDVVAGLDPDDADVVVRGAGFDPARGVIVALCAIPGADDGSSGPGPCTVGSAGSSAWVRSAPPPHAAEQAVLYGDGGAFEVELVLAATIDDDHDCREVPCAVVSLPEPGSVSDRGQQLAVPVAFAEAPTPTDAPADDPAPAGGRQAASADGSVVAGGATSDRPWRLAVLAIVAAGVGAAWWVRGRRARQVGVDGGARS